MYNNYDGNYRQIFSLVSHVTFLRVFVRRYNIELDSLSSPLFTLGGRCQKRNTTTATCSLSEGNSTSIMIIIHSYG